MQAPKLPGKSNRSRKYTGHGPRADRNEAHRADAAEMNAAWRAKSPAEQIAELDRRLGAGQGARKQRARIAAAVEAAKTQTTNKKRTGRAA